MKGERGGLMIAGVGGEVKHERGRCYLEIAGMRESGFVIQHSIQLILIVVLFLG